MASVANRASLLRVPLVTKMSPQLRVHFGLLFEGVHEISSGDVPVFNQLAPQKARGVGDFDTFGIEQNCLLIAHSGTY